MPKAGPYDHYQNPCSSCGKFMPWSKASSRPRGQGTCLDCRRKEARPYGTREVSPGRHRTCDICGAAFVTSRPSRVTRTCSQSCRNRLRYSSITPEQRRAASTARKRRKRHRKRGAVAEPYTLAEIAARDGYRCGLCRRKVDMTLSYQHPKSATVDHLVPLTKGGDDTRTNVQLAHRGCNARKQNRGGGEQLRIVG